MTTHECRKESRSLVVLAATCLAVLTVALLPWTACRAAIAAEGHFQRTLQVTGPVELSVQTGSGRITVRTGGDSTVHVQGTIRASNDFFSNSDAKKKVAYLESHPPIEQNGNVIKIGHITDSSLQRNVSISYELVVPANTQLKSRTGSGKQTIDGISGPLETSTGSGDISASNIGASVQATTGSGQINVENVKEGVRASTGSGTIRASGVEGSVRASTGSGSITVEQTGVADARVSTGSGDITLKGVRGLVHASSASGSITAEGGGTSPWHLQSVSGSVSVRIPSSVGFDLRAHTVSGRISTDRSLTIRGTLGEREITGKAGSGGFLLDVSTVSGNIHIAGAA
jgi:DUF4097 and DUF4098 domain-containing protein YvlB